VTPAGARAEKCSGRSDVDRHASRSQLRCFVQRHAHLHVSMYGTPSTRIPTVLRVLVSPNIIKVFGEVPLERREPFGGCCAARIHAMHVADGRLHRHGGLERASIAARCVCEVDPQQPPESYLTQFHSLSRGRKAPPERLKSLGQVKVRWL